MSSLIALIATPVAAVLRAIHAVLSSFLIPGSGPAWGLSIVLLTVCVRLVLFPLFVKQIKSQRRMQELAPQVKELQKRHKGDRETFNTELMKLYKDNNANPISGCLPLLLQLPVFFALFSVIREFKPGAGAKYGLTSDQLVEGGKAKVFGAPLSAAFNSSTELLHSLGGSAGVVKAVAVTMIVLMGATTFWTQKQMMARTGPAADPQQAQIQKFMLYVLPFSFAIFGFSFPIGVLLYWLTTNVWSMGQQRYVIARMPPVVPPGRGGPAGGRPPGKGGPGPRGDKDGPGPREDKEGPADGSSPEGPAGPRAQTASSGVLTTARPAGPAAKRQAGSRKNKSKKRSRR